MYVAYAICISILCIERARRVEWSAFFNLHLKGYDQESIKCCGMARFCEYQVKTRKKNTTHVSAHSCRAVDSNVQTRLLLQSFYLFLLIIIIINTLNTKEENSTIHIALFNFCCRLFKGDQFKLLPFTIICIVFEEVLSPSCYKPSLIRMKAVDIVCAYLCTVSKSE